VRSRYSAAARFQFRYSKGRETRAAQAFPCSRRRMDGEEYEQAGSSAGLGKPSRPSHELETNGRVVPDARWQATNAAREL